MLVLLPTSIATSYRKETARTNFTTRQLPPPTLTGVFRRKVCYSSSASDSSGLEAVAGASPHSYHRATRAGSIVISPHVRDAAAERKKSWWRASLSILQPWPHSDPWLIKIRVIQILAQQPSFSSTWKTNCLDVVTQHGPVHQRRLKLRRGTILVLRSDSG